MGALRTRPSARGVFRASRVSVFAVGVIASAASGAATVRADTGSEVPQYGWREVWGGADASKDVWLLYSGITIAPFSKDIYSDGLRFRLSGGYGQYHYGQTGYDCSGAAGAGNSCQAFARRVDVNHSYVEALAGFHLRLGDLTAKAFGGVSMVDHKLSRGSRDGRIRGFEAGATGALEFWLNVGDRGWTSLDLKYTTAHETGAARWRGGWRMLPSLSIGPEARFDSNVYDDAGRLGVFTRYEWAGGEVSVSAGYASSLDGGLSLDPSPYATLNLLSQF